MHIIEPSIKRWQKPGGEGALSIYGFFLGRWALISI
jgi:hypothetical protein